MKPMIVLAFLFVSLMLSGTGIVEAQTPAQTSAPSPHLPRGTATDVTNAEIKAAVQKTVSTVVSDQQLRVVSINGEYNIGVGVVHRAKTEGRNPGGGIEHSQITEVYHIIEGNGLS
jgi:hypothetical protein